MACQPCSSKNVYAVLYRSMGGGKIIQLAPQAGEGIESKLTSEYVSVGNAGPGTCYHGRKNGALRRDVKNWLESDVGKAMIAYGKQYFGENVPNLDGVLEIDGTKYGGMEGDRALAIYGTSECGAEVIDGKVEPGRHLGIDGETYRTLKKLGAKGKKAWNAIVAHELTHGFLDRNGYAQSEDAVDRFLRAFNDHYEQHYGKRPLEESIINRGENVDAKYQEKGLNKAAALKVLQEYVSKAA